MLCDYCAEPLFDTANVYSIPLSDPSNTQCTKWSGSFCSPQCRLSGNRHIEDTTRSTRDWDMRETWIRQLDLSHIDYAPDPWHLKRWNPENGMTRAQWLPESINVNNEIKKR